MTSRESKYNFLCWMTGISNTQMHNDGFRYSIQQWYIQSSLNQWCIIGFSLFSILSRQMVHTLIYLSNDFRTIIIHENISLLISGGLKAWGSLLLTFQFGNICFGSERTYSCICIFITMVESACFLLAPRYIKLTESNHTSLSFEESLNVQSRERLL